MRINGQFAVAPTLTEVLDLHAEDIGDKLNVSSTGYIQAYNPATRTAAVMLGETFVKNDGTFVLLEGPVTDLPVITMQGGGAHLSFPIEPGDECLLVFCDFNIENWFQNGGSPVPPDSRQHDLSDAFVFVGPNSLANPLVTALGPTEAGLATALARLAVDTDTDLIAVSNAAQSLLGLLTNLLAATTTLNAAVAGMSGASDPVVRAAATAAAANTAALTALGLALPELLKA